MLVRRIVLAASLVGLSVVGSASPTTAQAQGSAGPPRLAARCYAQDLTVGATYAPFEEQTKKWIATCVSAGREQELVSGNASLKAVYENVKHLSGRTARVTTDFGMMNLGAGSWGVKSVTFKTGVKAPAAPVSTPTPAPAARPKTLMPDEALPAGLEEELKVALVRVRAAIDEDAGTTRVLSKTNANRLRCKIQKLADPKTDDRQVSWLGICGGAGNAFSASKCSEYVDMKIKAEVKSVADLDRKEWWFLHHLRPDIVNASRSLFAGDSLGSVMRRLESIEGDKNYATGGLFKIGDRSQGFKGAPHYLFINDWLTKEQRDAKSVNSCE